MQVRKGTKMQNNSGCALYDPSKLDQSGEKRTMKEIRPGHFVYATTKEFAGYEEKIAQMEKELKEN